MRRIGAILTALAILILSGCAGIPLGVLRVEVNDATAGFSEQQGESDWYYQYYNGAEWRSMVFNRSTGFWEYKGTTWARIAPDYQHPGFDGTPTARVWQSPYADGTRVDVSMVLEKKEMGSDGVFASVEKDGETLWGPLLIENLDPIEIEFSTRMDNGERLYFVLDYNANPNFDWLWFRKLQITSYLTEEPLPRIDSQEEFAEAPELAEIDFSFTLGEKEIVANTAAVPIFRWFPDGHITWLPEEDGVNYQMYWAGSSSYRTIGPSLAEMAMDPTTPVLEPERGTGPDNGGTWLMNVFRLDGPALVGFYHTEDHYWGNQSNPENIAYKSIHVAYSDDNGRSWTKGGEIIRTDAGKPESMSWSGSGDFSVAYNEADESYYLYYSENNMIHLARSPDPLGAPGTWFKYTWIDPFTQGGLGGSGDPVWGINEVPGANPAVHWNEYLETWVMVWHGWDPPSISIATSEDLIHWSQPSVLVPSEFDTRNWYPNLIGTTDQLGGQTLDLYYSYWPSKYYWDNRRFIHRVVTLQKETEGE